MSSTINRTLAEVTIVGPDQKGVVAAVTNYIFENQGNIETVNQNVIQGLFGMHLESSFEKKNLNEDRFKQGLKLLGKRLGLETKVHFDEPTRPKNMAVLVTKEPHCLDAIIQAKKENKIKANIPLIVGTENTLKNLAVNNKFRFQSIAHNDQPAAEKKLIDLMEQYNIDFIVLARYMRVLTPNFVWRYPNRIVNVHPSLLPAFTGAYAYLQAYELGARIVGCTAHFVTEELDQGPIIWQDAYRVSPKENLESIKQRGRELEAKTLVQAIKLYLENKLQVYWGKVHFKN